MEAVRNHLELDVNYVPLIKATSSLFKENYQKPEENVQSDCKDVTYFDSVHLPGWLFKVYFEDTNGILRSPLLC
jgi:hypothetical protein